MNKEIPVKNCLYAFVSQTGWPFWEQVLFSEFNLIRIPSDRPPLDAELIHATSTAYELEEKGIFGSIGRFGQCVLPVFYQVMVEREWCRSFLIVLSITWSPGHNSSSNFTLEPEAQHEDCRWVARISKSKIPLAKWLGPSVCSFRNGRYVKETMFPARFVIRESISKIATWRDDLIFIDIWLWLKMIGTPK